MEGKMDKKLFKNISLLLLIAFTLLLIVINFNTVIKGFNGMISVIQPILLGAVIAFILNRPTKRIHMLFQKLNKVRIKDKILYNLALISTYMLFIILLVTLLAFVVPQFSESVQLLYDNMEGYIDNSQELLNKASDFLRLEEFDVNNINEIIDDVPKLLANAAGGVLPGVFNFASSLIGSIINIILGFIISMYILFDKKHLVDQVNKLIDAYMKPTLKVNFKRIVRMSNNTFGNFVIGQLTEAVILGVLCFIGMLILGYEYAVLISVLVGLTSVIPIVGAFIGVVPSVFILLIVNPSHAIGFLIFILILMQFEGNLIYPKVVGNSIGLPPLWVLSALIIGGGLFGILGMIIGIPLASIAYQLIKEDVKKRLYT